MSSSNFKLFQLTEAHDFPKWYRELRDYYGIHAIHQYYDLPPIGKKELETIQVDRPAAPICLEGPPISADLSERDYFKILLAIYQEKR